MLIRELHPDDWNQLSSLIFHSTNDWYHKNLNRGCFPGSDPSICRIFPEVYEELDPGCCLVAEVNGEIAGSCFYHPRETHVSIGIMNAHSKFSGQGVARGLLDEIIRKAGRLPVRLVSSALNLDSYSLYNRAGFQPFAVYQDMILPKGKILPPLSEKTRAATEDDIPAILKLEKEISGIRREKDWRYFLKNDSGIWRGMVFDDDGEIKGVLFSVDHPGSRMLGPGIMREEEEAFDLIIAQLALFRESNPVFLVPPLATELVKKLYQLGARNCEIHLGQVLGDIPSVNGIVMPTFMPETS